MVKPTIRGRRRKLPASGGTGDHGGSWGGTAPVPAFAVFPSLYSVTGACTLFAGVVA